MDRATFLNVSIVIQLKTIKIFKCRGELVKKVSRNNILLNSQNKDTTISSRKKLMNIQSAENCKGFSETVRQLPEIEDSKF
jgi:hypothetical protein